MQAIELSQWDGPRFRSSQKEDSRKRKTESYCLAFQFEASGLLGQLLREPYG